MSKMLYRIYVADTSKHYTLVECRDGSFLEVKNPDNNNTKTKFNSLEEWAYSHNVTIDAIKSEEHKPVVKSILPEINIPDTNFQYGRWLYSTIYNFNKKLFKNVEFINAFNNFCNIYNKYKTKIYTSDWELINSPQKYNPKWLTFIDKYKLHDGSEQETQFGGLNWSFKGIYGVSAELKKAIEEELKQISSKIRTAYKTIYDLAGPSILPKLEKKYEIINAKIVISSTKRCLRKYDNHLCGIMYSIESKIQQLRRLDDNLKAYNNKKEEYRRKLEEAEAIIAKFEKKKGSE